MEVCKGLLARCEHGMEDKINTDLKGIGFEDLDWI
jgi:hypothetical protein